MNERVTLENKIDRLSADVGEMLERQRSVSALLEEFSPILREIMRVGEGKLQGLEERGYFAFLRQMMRTFDQVVGSYEEAELERFGDSVVSILDTVRNFTQPDVLDMANEAADAVHDAGDAEPVGAWGMFRATKDPDVRKGMAVMMEVLRQVGKGAGRMKERPGTRRPAPRKALPAPAPRVAASAAAAPASAAPASAAPASAARSSVDQQAAQPPAQPPATGLFDAQGFLNDPLAWTRDMAVQIAAAEGIALTDTHWQVLDWARAEFLDSGSSPNVRRLSKGSGVEIRAIYQLFPKAPGKAVARLAGIPKPGGCI